MGSGSASPRCAAVRTARQQGLSLLLSLTMASTDAQCCCLYAAYVMQDKNPDNRAQAEAKFKDISEAYEASCCRGTGAMRDIQTVVNNVGQLDVVCSCGSC